MGTKEGLHDVALRLDIRQLRGRHRGSTSHERAERSKSLGQNRESTLEDTPNV